MNPFRLLLKGPASGKQELSSMKTPFENYAQASFTLAIFLKWINLNIISQHLAKQIKGREKPVRFKRN